MTFNIEDLPRAVWRTPTWIVMIGLCLTFWFAVASALSS